MATDRPRGVGNCFCLCRTLGDNSREIGNVNEIHPGIGVAVDQDRIAAHSALPYQYCASKSVHATSPSSTVCWGEVVKISRPSGGIGYMTYDVCMKRTTIFLTDDLEHLLQETARRTHRPQAEIVRDALGQYLRAQPRPWPRSIGIGSNTGPSVTSENVKGWVREQWRQELDEAEETEPVPPAC